MTQFNFGRWFGTRAISVLIAVCFCAFLGHLLVGTKQDYLRFLVSLAGIFVTLAVSLNLINGVTGQFSIGHAAFFQIGAYSGAVLANGMFSNLVATKPLLWLVLAIIFGALGAGLAGFIVGLPSLRLKGDYLAVVTLGIGEIVTIIAKNQKSLGEAYGLSVIKIESVFMIALLAIICIAVCRNLLKSAHGLAFLAVREDEVASAAMGVNLTRIKVTAFVIGSAFAGAAGALYGHTKGFVSPADFSMDISFLILTMVVLGGTGSITGTTIAAMVLFVIPEKMRDLKYVQMGSPLGVAVGIIVAVVLLRKIQESFHGSGTERLARNVGAVAIGTVVAFLAAKILTSFPVFQGQINGALFRQPVLAITLVVLMLLRPQGIFGHHEFSWSWVQKLLGKKAPETEVAA